MNCFSCKTPMVKEYGKYDARWGRYGNLCDAEWYRCKSCDGVQFNPTEVKRIQSIISKEAEANGCT